MSLTGGKKKERWILIKSISTLSQMKYPDKNLFFDMYRILKILTITVQIKTLILNDSRYPHTHTLSLANFNFSNNASNIFLHHRDRSFSQPFFSNAHPAKGVLQSIVRNL